MRVHVATANDTPCGVSIHPEMAAEYADQERRRLVREVNMPWDQIPVAVHGFELHGAVRKESWCWYNEDFLILSIEGGDLASTVRVLDNDNINLEHWVHVASPRAGLSIYRKAFWFERVAHWWRR